MNFMIIDNFRDLNTICISLVSDKNNFQARERNLSKGKGEKKVCIYILNIL